MFEFGAAAVVSHLDCNEIFKGHKTTVMTSSLLEHTEGTGWKPVATKPYSLLIPQCRKKQKELHDICRQRIGGRSGEKIASVSETPRCVGKGCFGIGGARWPKTC